MLLVVVDTEEEFDWDAPFDRGSVSVDAISDIHRIQEVFDEFEIRPTYVVSYPVASQRAGVEPLKGILEMGRAEIGVHQHPWVCPPHEEEVTRRNSFAGNLSPDLERAKLQTLKATICESFGCTPKAYKAGRYGIGPNSQRILEAEGIEVDLSVNPPFDFSEEGGPDFSGSPPTPFWFGRGRQLLGVPCTGGYVGLLSARGRAAYRLADSRPGRRIRMPGILARLRLLDRLHLSPEGYSPAEHRRITRALFARGLRVFTFSLHSPSVRPGMTPFVRSDADVRLFLDACRRFFDFFLSELRGLSLTASELRQDLLLNHPRGAN